MKREWLFAGTGALLGGLLAGVGTFIFMQRRIKTLSANFNDFVVDMKTRMSDDEKEKLSKLMYDHSPHDLTHKYEKIFAEGLREGIETATEHAPVNVSNVNIMKKEFTPSQAITDMADRLNLKTQTNDKPVVEIISYEQYGQAFEGENGQPEEYDLYEYRYYSDNVFCNEADEVINAREIFGDPIMAEYYDKYFPAGHVLPDNMYVRHHGLKADIEIVGDMQSYKEDILPTLPQVTIGVGVTDFEDDDE